MFADPGVVNDVKRALLKVQKTHAFLQCSGELLREDCRKLRKELETTLIQSHGISQNLSEKSSLSALKNGSASLKFSSKAECHKQCDAENKITENTLSLLLSCYIYLF